GRVTANRANASAPPCAPWSIKPSEYVMAEQYGSSRFTLTAEIAGETHQLVQFQMSFALNAVPKATALLAVGRNARNVSEVAPIHRVGSQLIYLQPAKIYMEAIGVFAADGTTWPDGRTLLFDGYLTGVSYRRSEG